MTPSEMLQVEDTAKALTDRIDLLRSKDGAQAFLDEQKSKAQIFLADKPTGKDSHGPVSMQDVIAIQMRYIETHPQTVVDQEIQRLIEEESRLKFLYPEVFKSPEGVKG
ncbi:MAG TPA: hypothetical protein P5175_06255 [Anaerohalosphaeraceae bacterium]|nr:hypothetical protein [Anaerohalosphaeraceae bacterium]HRS71437.1 hypothetical protein [Anaerohalosphaeraceae bacterium]